MTTYAKFEERANRMNSDPIYSAGFKQGLTGKPTPKHYIFALDRTSWADGVRDGATESKRTGDAIKDWMSRSQPPRR